VWGFLEFDLQQFLVEHVFQAALADEMDHTFDKINETLGSGVNHPGLFQNRQLPRSVMQNLPGFFQRMVE